MIEKGAMTMPQKPRYKRVEILAAALEIAAEKGIDALSVRELRNSLGCSVSPIFTVFDSMQEIHKEVRKTAFRYFEEYARETLPDKPLLLQLGMKMVMLGVQEPYLYQLLFMQKKQEATAIEELFNELGELTALCLELIEKDYGLSSAQAKQVFQDVWIYAFGLGALCATWACRFSEEELSGMLKEEFHARLAQIQSNEKS